MNIKEILKNTHLSPLDAEILLSLAANKPREYLFANPEKKLSPAQIIKFDKLASRRLKGEPIAYINGKKEFFGLEFEVGRSVLIPRPETELLVEIVLENILKSQFSTLNSALIDVGTGSGNIIVSVVKNTPAKSRNRLNFYATDISKKALFVAKNNAKRHKIAGNIKFFQSSFLGYFLKNKANFENLLIVANLPYVSDNLYKKNKHGLKYEPKTALISGKNGLKHYERLLKQVKKILFFGRCSLIVEISPEQKTGLARIVKRELPRAKIKFFKDLSGKWRIAEIYMFVDKKSL